MMPCAGTAFGVYGAFADKDAFCGEHARAHHAPRLPLEPVHIRLDIDVCIRTRCVKGVLTHTVVARVDGARELVLNAEDFVLVHVQHCSFTYDGHFITIHTKPMKKGDKLDIAVNFEVRKPITGLLFAPKGEGTFAVSDHETERARYWLPLVDHPSVRTTLLFNIATSPEHDLTVLANGEFVGEHVKDGKKLTTWKMDQLTPSYLLCVAIGKFLCVKDEDANGRNIRYFAPSDSRLEHNAQDLKITFGRTPEMIKFLEDKLKVPLPWPKYYQFAAGDIGGAMENSSLVSYDETFVIDERNAAARSMSVDSTVVHELAHSWFGNTVVCADFLYSFLKESFATLISYEWAHAKHGHDEFQYRLDQASGAYQSEAASYTRPVVSRHYESSWQLFDSHIYSGGAWRLHMLRCFLGNEIFWAGVSNYIRKNMWQTVEVHDLRHALEEVSGESLTSFFDQWFHAKGYPQLDASFSYGHGLSTITLKQTQVDKKRGVGPFQFNMEVAVEEEEGVWKTHVIAMADTSTTARVVFKAPRPLQIVLDPDMKILHKLNKFTGIGDDQLIRSLERAPTFCGRRMAVNMLHESGSKRARAALQKALVSEKARGLRSIISRKLSETQNPAVLRALVDALSTEKDPTVIASLLRAIGSYRHPDAEAALVKYVCEGHEKKAPAAAIGAALHGLGVQRNVRHVGLISSYLEDASKKGKGTTVQASAADALGRLREPRATEVLMRNLTSQDRLTVWVRNRILSAIGTSVEWAGVNERRKIYEFVRDFFYSSDDPSERLSAASVLAGFGDVAVDHCLYRELEKEVPNQSKPYARKIKERALAKQGCGQEGDRRALHTAIEKGASELAKLKSRVDELESLLKAHNAGDEAQPKANGKKSKKMDAKGAETAHAVCANAKTVPSP